MGPLRSLWDISKLAMFGHFRPQKGHYDKGFPKGGGGGGGSDVWEKFPNNIVFFVWQRTLDETLRTVIIVREVVELGTVQHPSYSEMRQGILLIMAL